MKNILLSILAVVWIMKGCFTLDDVKRFLNTLPLSESLNAKIVVINSQRSFLGKLSTPYYVLYPKGLK